MKPILKWVGGKRQLMKEIIARLPEEFNEYYEPFAGGASVLFELKPEVAHINDINPELINMYKQIKSSNKKLVKVLKQHKNESDYFYKIRSLDRDEIQFKKLSKTERAARIIYLNKTCYNGMYRVNSKGELNVPFGRYKNPVICDEDNIMEVSSYFKEKRITFSNEDFSLFLSKCQRGDFVYLDPPYDPVSLSASFTAYSAEGFNRDDQIRLKEVCDMLDQRGVKFMLSNSRTKFIEELYANYNIEVVNASRNVNSVASKRGKIEEVLVRNY